ncbi:MAG: hypothetical protein ACD_79C00109G0001 [uncultured bacterium]|nr:MAG: hypothetical protein ACD_79C00109G0001 [uncultured bacterium]
MTSVNVMVENKGTFDETSTLTFSINGVVTETRSVSVNAGTSKLDAFVWNTTNAPLGTNTIKANIAQVLNESSKKITDNTMTKTVTVIRDTTGIIMHVGNIAMSLKDSGPSTSGVAVVSLVNQSGTPVEGATIIGKWTVTGATSNVSGVTDVAGQVTFQSSAMRKAATGTVYTFEVTNVSLAGGAVYNSAGNVENSDSVTKI